MLDDVRRNAGIAPSVTPFILNPITYCAKILAKALGYNKLVAIASDSSFLGSRCCLVVVVGPELQPE
jgi:hypothetical protein